MKKHKYLVKDKLGFSIWNTDVMPIFNAELKLFISQSSIDDVVEFTYISEDLVITLLGRNYEQNIGEIVPFVFSLDRVGERTTTDTDRVGESYLPQVVAQHVTTIPNDLVPIGDLSPTCLEPNEPIKISLFNGAISSLRSKLLYLIDTDRVGTYGI